LRREIENATGLSTAQYTIEVRGKNGSKADTERVFDSDITRKENMISEFSVHLQTKVLMEIFVITYTGKKITLNISPSETIENVKKMLQEHEGILAPQYMLNFTEKPFRGWRELSEKSLSENGIKEVRKSFCQVAWPVC
jgi:hypothetical protein